MDVYLFVIFWGSEVVETTSDKEGGMRKVGFYLFTLLPFLEFPSCREADVATRLVLTGYLFHLF